MADNKVDHGPRIGADPEMFVRKVLPSGRGTSIVPVCGLVGGTKAKPYKCDSRLVVHRGCDEAVGDYAYQEDGVAFEINIPASRYVHDFQRHVQNMMGYSRRVLEAKGLAVSIKAAHHFKDTELASPQASTLGCDPDFNAWGQNGIFKRDAFEARQLGSNRYCGGHIHLQYNKGNVPTNIMAQLLDLFIGLPAVPLDKQGTRRNFYGLPGLYREKPYGIEYRSLSNFWIKERALAHNIPNYLAMALMSIGESANNNPDLLKAAYSKAPWADVRKAIQEEDINTAQHVITYLHAEGVLPEGVMRVHQTCRALAVGQEDAQDEA